MLHCHSDCGAEVAVAVEWYSGSSSVVVVAIA